MEMEMDEDGRFRWFASGSSEGDAKEGRRGEVLQEGEEETWEGTSMSFTVEGKGEEEGKMANGDGDEEEKVREAEEGEIEGEESKSERPRTGSVGMFISATNLLPFHRRRRSSISVGNAQTLSESMVGLGRGGGGGLGYAASDGNGVLIGGSPEHGPLRASPLFMGLTHSPQTVKQNCSKQLQFQFRDDDYLLSDAIDASEKESREEEDDATLFFANNTGDLRLDAYQPTKTFRENPLLCGFFVASGSFAHTEAIKLQRQENVKAGAEAISVLRQQEAADCRPDLSPTRESMANFPLVRYESYDAQIPLILGDSARQEIDRLIVSHDADERLVRIALELLVKVVMDQYVHVGKLAGEKILQEVVSKMFEGGIVVRARAFEFLLNMGLHTSFLPANRSPSVFNSHFSILRKFLSKLVVREERNEHVWFTAMRVALCFLESFPAESRPKKLPVDVLVEFAVRFATRSPVMEQVLVSELLCRAGFIHDRSFEFKTIREWESSASPPTGLQTDPLPASATTAANPRSILSTLTARVRNGVGSGSVVEQETPNDDIRGSSDALSLMNGAFSRTTTTKTTTTTPKPTVVPATAALPPVPAPGGKASASRQLIEELKRDDEESSTSVRSRRKTNRPPVTFQDQWAGSEAASTSASRRRVASSSSLGNRQWRMGLHLSDSLPGLSAPGRMMFDESVLEAAGGVQALIGLSVRSRSTDALRRLMMLLATYAISRASHRQKRRSFEAFLSSSLPPAAPTFPQAPMTATDEESQWHLIQTIADRQTMPLTITHLLRFQTDNFLETIMRHVFFEPLIEVEDETPRERKHRDDTRLINAQIDKQLMLFTIMELKELRLDTAEALVRNHPWILWSNEVVKLETEIVIFSRRRDVLGAVRRICHKAMELDRSSDETFTKWMRQDMIRMTELLLTSILIRNHGWCRDDEVKSEANAFLCGARLIPIPILTKIDTNVLHMFLRRLLQPCPLSPSATQPEYTSELRQCLIEILALHSVSEVIHYGDDPDPFVAERACRAVVTTTDNQLPHARSEAVRSVLASQQINGASTLYPFLFVRAYRRHHTS